ncbi:CBO0543 family protein [Paenibacillus sp. NPDC056579]|uniref:CBO0543 family protein n=1 Tax=Paenibacillus sp. NPDC056579 TaxID=3345871 RepID=UPI0036AA23F8
MKLEWTILVIVWMLTFSLFFFIPHRKFRLAQAAILFKQMITWIIGQVVVELGLLEYPVRCFASVHRSSFTFEFLSYPVICGLFNARYPAERSLWFKLFYFCSYCTAITVIEVLIEKYTELITYIHWSWYWTWITLLITFGMSRIFCKWFFSLK